MKTSGKIITVAVIAALGFGGWSYLRKPEGGTKLHITTSKLQKGEINSKVTATGQMEPIQKVEVGTQVSGIIDKLYVDYNSVVTKGQLLAEIDRTTLESDLASSRSMMLSNKTEYEYQEKQYKRTKMLFDKSLVSEQEFETAQYSFEKSRNAYDKSKSDMVKAQRNLDYSRILSPIDGVVLSRAVDEGQTVAASFNTPTLFTIANDLSKMQVVANVDEADIGEVEEGQRVTFTVDAFPNDVFDGDVRQVRQQATTTSNVVTYEVIINAPNPDLKLKPGLTANITIYTKEKSGVLVLPNKALQYTPDQDVLGDSITIIPGEGVQGKNMKRVWKYVTSPEGTKLVATQIEIGETNGIVTEIVGGLNEGEIVATGASMTVATTIAKTNSSNESNPFMPARPGSNSNRQTQGSGNKQAK